MDSRGETPVGLGVCVVASCQVASVLTSAFNEPFPHLSGMIRLSFVVGGGKGVRTKYDDNMPKWCSQALKSIGFEVRALRDRHTQRTAGNSREEREG